MEAAKNEVVPTLHKSLFCETGDGDHRDAIFRVSMITDESKTGVVMPNESANLSETQFLSEPLKIESKWNENGFWVA